MYGDNGSLRLSQSLTTYMTSANGNSSLRTENSVFLAPESPFYLLCVIFSLLHFFSVDGPVTRPAMVVAVTVHTESLTCT